ncbi:MAG: hypothetical protein V1681_05825, partial [Candidatus Neomarinimicrobiota bacterium]
MKNNFRIICLLVLLIIFTGAQAPTRLNEFPAVGQATTGINLFILSFDNYRADPEIDWLKEGFVDF